MVLRIVLLLAALTQQLTAALPTISAKGSKLFTSDGSQFYIKGVAYQLTPHDPLTNPQQCKLDSALMKTLGANSIRVYHVDPSQSHDSCMSTFSDAGIYAWIDLDTFSTQIIPENGGLPRWNETQYEYFQKVMDKFQGYDNVAGFFVGNEMLTTGSTSSAAPYIKAAARDMKAYRDSKGYRDIPIGYSAADVSQLRPMLQNYLACGGNSSETVDFYSLNAYEWCGQSTYPVSGYSELERNATDYNIPIFFSETGCNDPEPRTFDDQTAIFGPDMEDTWSGAIIYEWIQETNNYGLISYGPTVAATVTNTNIMAGISRTGTPTPISPDFPNLSSQWATLSPTGVSANAYTPSLTPPACPAYTKGTWEVEPKAPLPVLGATGTKYSRIAAASATQSGSSRSSGSTPSSAASPTRSPSLAVAKRDLNSFLKEHHFIAWILTVVLSIAGVACLV